MQESTSEVEGYKRGWRQQLRLEDTSKAGGGKSGWRLQ